MSQISSIKHQLRLTEWAQMIRECQNSDLTVLDWCTANNINPKTYYYRLKQVREQSLNNLPAKIKSQLPAAQESSLAQTEENNITFRKLEVQSPLPNMQAAVIVRLPNATLEVTNDSTERTLEAVLLALKAVCYVTGSVDHIKG